MQVIVAQSTEEEEEEANDMLLTDVNFGQMDTLFSTMHTSQSQGSSEDLTHFSQSSPNFSQNMYR